ncbi:MAG: hypothetical protein JW925_12035 [Syntrophaceae bacterium]|nr:hypothetical protein [Syntrophaceae bacterium]
MLPKTESGIRRRIQSYKTAFGKEKRKYGCYDDGYGKRYIMFYLFYLLNDDKESAKYFKWYQKNFHDDMGEPFQLLCWALILKRMGKEKEATIKLAEHYQSNLYIIPKIIGKPVSEYKFWHSCNYEFIDYANYGPQEVIEKFTQDEIEWLKEELASVQFNNFRIRYIDLYSKLKKEKDGSKRGEIVKEAGELIENIFADKKNEEW